MWQDIPGTRSDWIATIGGIMSTSTYTADTARSVKPRQPWAVALLNVITLGLYSIYWYYQVNREMRDVGAVYRDRELAESRPGQSLLAITLGGLIVIPRLISLAHTVSRLRAIERAVRGTAGPGTGLTVLLLASAIVPAAGYVKGVGVVFALLGAIGFAIAMALIQRRLNEVWSADERLASGPAAARSV